MEKDNINVNMEGKDYLVLLKYRESKRTKLSKEGPTQVDDETNNIVNPDSPLGSIINGLISNKS